MRHQSSVTRLAQRYVAASSESRAFVHDVERALDLLQDAISAAELPSSDSPVTGEALADWDRDVAQVVRITRNFAAQVSPLLRKIR